MFRLDGRTALVTGASQGIGEAIARHLAANGARVVLASRNLDRLMGLQEELNSAGSQTVALELDLADVTSIADCLKSLPKEFAEIDILVNNAGITRDQLLAKMSIEDWTSVIQTNLTGTFAITKVVARGMKKGSRGRIVIISSVIGQMGNIGQCNYAASKAGLVGFAKSLAREMGRRGVTVNVVSPGYIDTEMTRGLTEKDKEKITSNIVLHRLGHVSDVANAVHYLASDEAGYVTGAVLNVNGGLYM